LLLGWGEQTLSRYLDKRIIGEYFCDMKKKYNMVDPGDIRSYSLAMFDSL